MGGKRKMGEREGGKKNTKESKLTHPVPHFSGISITKSST